MIAFFAEKLKICTLNFHRIKFLDKAFFYGKYYCNTTCERMQSNHVTPEDWKNRWSANNIGWHRNNINNFLEEFWSLIKRDLPQQPKACVPLCGKTLDLKMLYDAGCEVVGVEVSELAVSQFFQEQNLEYDASKIDGIDVWQTKDKRLRIYLMDLYQFPRMKDDEFDFIWDRGSFVAINREDRKKYVSTMAQLMKVGGVHLLEFFIYNPEEYSGPPHSSTKEELTQLWSATHAVEFLTQLDMNDTEDTRTSLAKWKLSGGSLHCVKFVRCDARKC